MSRNKKSSIEELNSKPERIKRYIAIGFFCVVATLVFLSFDAKEASAQFDCFPPCDIGQMCLLGQCTDGPGLPNCDDGNPCTVGRLKTSCTTFCGEGQDCCTTFCEYSNVNEGGSCDDGNGCTDSVCNSGTCQVQATLPDGNSCDTGDPCTDGSCLSGACEASNRCDDGQFCNGVESCRVIRGDITTCDFGLPPSGSDGVACTDDICIEATDSFNHIANDARCDNGLFCDGTETCDANLGCRIGFPPSVDDGVACTLDSCDEASDTILNVANNSICDNGLFCDGSETCDATQGCQDGAAPEINDGVACTDDSCDEASDTIINVANNSICDNGLFCDGSETCDATQGCQDGAAPEINDGVACTDDSCDEASDSIVNVANNSICDNGLFCDGTETCDATQGCQDGTAPDTDDGVACTDDSCDEASDSIVNVANNSICDNGLFCDGSETCDAAQGCQDGTAPEINDGVACTDDSCDEANDVVVNTANNSNCDNGLFCDGSETCDAAQGCQDGTAPDINDGVACTDDSCDEEADKIVNVAVDTNCDNGLFCDGEETCDLTEGCQDGTAPEIDDEVACTDDSCDEENDIIVNAANDDNCDNGVFCDGSETCNETEGCQDGTVPEIDDGVACTDDSCDEEADVVVNATNDSLCDNNIFCDGIETCNAAAGCIVDENPPTGEVCGENPEGVCIDLACVFDGMITIVKMADPNDGTDFLFGCTDADGAACNGIGDVDGIFALDDEPVDTDGVPDSETFSEVLAGVYSVQEILPAGWESTDIICENDDDDGTVVDIEMAEAMIDLDPGEDITCTFFNLDAPVTIETVNNGGDILIGNEQNFITINGATPNKRVYIIWGFSEGIFTLNGNLCSGVQFGIRPPRLLASIKADSEGNIHTPVYIPYLGKNLAFMQTLDSGNCNVGEVVEFPLLAE